MNGPDTGTLPILLVIEGGRSGERIAIPQGNWSIGRDPASDIVLEDAGVSRRHATLTSDGVGLSIEDAGSTNGTRVNGASLSSTRRLAAGDEVRLGAMAFLVEGQEVAAAAPPAAVPPAVAVPPVAALPPTPVPPASAPPVAAPQAATPVAVASAPRRGRVRLGRVVLVGALANLVLLVAAVVIEFATDWTGIGPWLAAPLLGMVAALVDVARQAATREPEPAVPAPSSAPRTAPTSSDGRPSPAVPAGPVPRRKRRVPVVVAVVVSVLLIGGGGIAIAYGVATATAFITGNQTGTERLVGEVTVDDQGVSTTVHSVEHTQDFTRVELTVVNGLANTITLPVFGNATLSAADGTSLGGDPFRSSWNQTIAPGQTRRGTLVFLGHLDPAGTTATLSFATVFEQGFDGPSSIVVEGLVLAPVE